MPHSYGGGGFTVKHRNQLNQLTFFIVDSGPVVLKIILLFVLLLCLLARAPAVQSQESPGCLIEPSQSEVDFTLIDILHTVHERFSIRQSRVTQGSRTGENKGAIIVDPSSDQSSNDVRERRMTSDELKAATFSEVSFTCLLTAQQRVRLLQEFAFHPRR